MDPQTAKEHLLELIEELVTSDKSADTMVAAFGIWINTNGETDTIPLPPDSEGDSIQLEDMLIELLQAEIEEAKDSDEIIACAVVREDESAQAIIVTIEHKDGDAEQAAFTYVIEDGEIDWEEEPNTTEAEAGIFIED